MKKVIVAAMLIFGLMVGIVNADVIPLIRGVRGNYDIFVTFSDGSRASFLLDTGATITSLSPETFIRLASSGTVSMTFLGEGHAKLADNSRVVTSHWTLGQVSLSPSVVVHNLEVMIAPSGGSNLLGMNFLSQMGTWSIDSGNNTLITGQRNINPPQNQLPPHVEAAGGQWFPARGYRWVNPSNIPGSGYAVVPIPNVITTSLTPPYTYTPALGYRWVNPNDIGGSGFAVVAIPSTPIVATQIDTSPAPLIPAPIVIPHQRVWNFALGMSKKEVLKIGKPQDQISSGLSAGVQLWKYVNKNTGNKLEVYFTKEQVSLICFTSPKFFTAEGITTVNFDTPNVMLTYAPGTLGHGASFDYVGGGLLYLVGTREGCVMK